MRLRTTRERFRSGSTRRPREYEESRQGVVKYQYFSTPGNEKYFRRSALFRSRLDGSSEQLSLLEPGRAKSNEFSLCATSLIYFSFGGGGGVLLKSYLFRAVKIIDNAGWPLRPSSD